MLLFMRVSLRRVGDLLVVWAYLRTYSFRGNRKVDIFKAKVHNNQLSICLFRIGNAMIKIVWQIGRNRNMRAVDKSKQMRVLLPSLVIVWAFIIDGKVHGQLIPVSADRHISASASGASGDSDIATGFLPFHGRVSSGSTTGSGSATQDSIIGAGSIIASGGASGGGYPDYCGGYGFGGGASFFSVVFEIRSSCQFSLKGTVGVGGVDDWSNTGAYVKLNGPQEGIWSADYFCHCSPVNFNINSSLQPGRYTLTAVAEAYESAECSFRRSSASYSLLFMLDSDGDGILDDGDGNGVSGDHPCTGNQTVNCDDNCPNTTNSGQQDLDRDGFGDACDNCPNHPNPDQADCDNDGKGDVCAIAEGISQDCNSNGLPDSCELSPSVKLLVSSYALDSVESFDGVSGAPLSDFISPSGYGLDEPNSIMVSGQGTVYVASVLTDSVLQLVGRTGRLIRQFSGGGLDGPVGIVSRDNSKLLVASYFTNSVIEYDLLTGAGRTLVVPGSGGLQGAGTLLLGTNNRLWVSSEDSNQVLEYDAITGNFLRIAAQGSGLSVPTGLVFDAQGNLLVASLATDSILKYAPDGTSLGAFVAAGAGGLDGPQGMAWGPNGNLFVCSRLNNSILEFNRADGTPVDRDPNTPGTQAVFAGVNSPSYLAFMSLPGDCDNNGIPDGCDPDTDGDGWPDGCDNCPTVANPDQADSNSDGIGDACQPPKVMAVVSRKAHGDNGEFDIDIKISGAIECRQNGPTKIMVTFDQIIQQVSGTVNDVTVSGGTVSNLAIDGSELTLTMSEASNAALLTIAFPGISNVDGQVVTETLCFGVLTGDTNGDKKVNVLDLLDIKGSVNLPMTASNFRKDINADGKINVVDLLVTKNNLNKTISGSCP